MVGRHAGCLPLHIAPKKTARGGYTERRYTPVDLLELMVLAELRRQGVSVARMRRLLDTLRSSSACGCSRPSAGPGPLTLLTDGSDDLRAHGRRRVLQPAARSAQPLLVHGRAILPLKELTDEDEQQTWAEAVQQRKSKAWGLKPGPSISRSEKSCRGRRPGER